MARERADLGNESRDPLYLISERGSSWDRSRMLTNPRDAASQQVQHVHLRLHRLANRLASPCPFQIQAHLASNLTS